MFKDNPPVSPFTKGEGKVAIIKYIIFSILKAVWYRWQSRNYLM